MNQKWKDHVGDITLSEENPRKMAIWQLLVISLAVGQVISPCHSVGVGSTAYVSMVAERWLKPRSVHYSRVDLSSAQNLLS